jgi:hypothetical protein
VRRLTRGESRVAGSATAKPLQPTAPPDARGQAADDGDYSAAGSVALGAGVLLAGTLLVSLSRRAPIAKRPRLAG